MTDLFADIARIRDAVVTSAGDDEGTAVFIDTTVAGIRVAVHGLCPETYGEQGEYRDKIRVAHDINAGDVFAYLNYYVPDGQTWSEAVDEIVAFLSTESPIPA